MVMPFWDATGNAKIGAFRNGATVRQLSGLPPQQVRYPNNSPLGCVKLYWPETFTALDRLKGFTQQMHVGSLFDRKRDRRGIQACQPLRQQLRIIWESWVASVAP